MLAGDLAGAAAYGGAGGEGLEAAAVAAGAAGACGLDGHVAELAARALRAAQQDAVRDHASPDPGPERDEHQVVHLAPGPEAELAPGSGVGVVLDREGNLDSRLQFVLEGDALDGVQVRREHDPVLLGENEAGHGEARPADLEPVLHLQDGSGDALHQAFGRSRRRVVRLLEDLTLRPDHAGGDLGPSHVDPYGVQSRLQSTTSSSTCPEYRLR